MAFTPPIAPMPVTPEASSSVTLAMSVPSTVKSQPVLPDRMTVVGDVEFEHLGEGIGRLERQGDCRAAGLNGSMMDTPCRASMVEMLTVSASTHVDGALVEAIGGAVEKRDGNR